MFKVYGLGVGCLGVWVFWCLRVMTFRKIKKGDQGGVKPDIFKRAAQKWPKFRVGVKNEDFGPPLRPKKCF